MTQPPWPQQGQPWGQPVGWGATGQFQPPTGYASPGQPSGPQPPRRGGALRALLLAGALVIVVALAGLAMVGLLRRDDENSSPTTPSQESTPAAPTSAPVPSTSEPGLTPEPSVAVPTLYLPTTTFTPAPQTPTPTTAPPTTPAPAPTSTSPQPIPTPSGVGSPDKKPKDLPYPSTLAQAKKLTNTNKLYSQTVAVPTECGMPLIKPAKISKKNLQKHLTRVAGCLTMVWRPAVRAAGYSMPYPVTTVFTGQITSPCGDLYGYNAYYCSGNQRIYFDTQLYEILPDRDYSLDLIMAHEYGHAVQGRTGILISAFVQINNASTAAKQRQINRRLELQADCFAGIGMNALAHYTGIDKTDRKGFADIMRAIADDTMIGRIDVHGSAKARARWLNRGLDSAKLSVCRTFTAKADKVR